MGHTACTEPLCLYKGALNPLLYHGSVGRDTSVWIATGYDLEGLEIESRRGVRLFSTRPDRPWHQPSLLYKGYRVFSRVKLPGHGDDNPPPSSAEVTERVELTYTAPLGLRGLF